MQDEMFRPNQRETGTSIAPKTLTEIPQVKLISKKQLTENEIREFANGEKVNGNRKLLPAPYASSIPIYKYLYYGSCQNIDHYFGTGNSSSLVVQGVTYSYEHHSFNIMPENNFPGLVALYRHYSSAERDHILSTESQINSYASEGIIGYIFTTPQIGTVPLLEYYSSKRKSHHYIVRNTEIDWIFEHDPDYLYVKNVGYVYPGSAIDEKKEATNFIISHGTVSGVLTFRLRVKVMEGDKYWELVYEVEGPKEGTSVTIPINNTYTIVSCIAIVVYGVYEQNLIDEITYPVSTFSYDGWNVKKVITNYNVKLM